MLHWKNPRKNQVDGINIRRVKIELILITLGLACNEQLNL